MENKDRDELERLLKDNLSDKSKEVPAFVWDRIEREIYPRKKRRGLFWWWFAGGLLLVAAGSCAWYFQSIEHSAGQTTVIGRTDTPPGSPKKRTVTAGSKHSEASPAGKKNSRLSEGTDVGTRERALLTNKKNGKSRPSGENIPKEHFAGQATRKISGNEAISEIPEASEKEREPAVVVSPKDQKTMQQATEEAPEPGTLGLLHFTAFPDPVASYLPFREKPAQKALSPFSISVYGGASLYDIALFRDYFTSGQLSRRRFASSGYEAGLVLEYALNDRFGLYAGFAYNAKKTEFNYNMAISEAEYFGAYQQGELIALDQTDDEAQCFLAKNVGGAYTVKTTMLSLGATYRIFRRNRFFVSVDVQCAANSSSKLRVSDFRVAGCARYPVRPFRSVALRMEGASGVRAQQAVFPGACTDVFDPAQHRRIFLCRSIERSDRSAGNPL